MAQYNSKNQSSRVARRWFTDIDVNLKNHPQSKDVVLKYDLQSIFMKRPGTDGRERVHVHQTSTK